MFSFAIITNQAVKRQNNSVFSYFLVRATCLSREPKHHSLKTRKPCSATHCHMLESWQTKMADLFTNTKANSKNHLSLPQSFHVSSAYCTAVVWALS